jgi:aspartate ammonia-lyase
LREESDLLGKLIVPDEGIYDIHTLKALDNFPITCERISLYLIKAYLFVKSAATKTNYKLGFLDEEKFRPISRAIVLLLEETEKAIKKE